MKKYIIILLSIFLLGFSACSNSPQKTVSKAEINNIVASELQKIDKGYHEETLKALSVILRTNININNDNSYNQPINDKYLSIANKTNKEVLKNKNNTLIKICFDNNEEYYWQKNIKKSKLLEFALKNKINLTNISVIEPIFENEKIVGINIANKFFDYEQLAKEFGLESNKIESIEKYKTEIIIKGKNKGFSNAFNIEKSEQLSNNNYNYKEILKEFFDDFKIN